MDAQFQQLEIDMRRKVDQELQRIREHLILDQKRPTPFGRCNAGLQTHSLASQPPHLDGVLRRTSLPHTQPPVLGTNHGLIAQPGLTAQASHHLEGVLRSSAALASKAMVQADQLSSRVLGHRPKEKAEQPRYVAWAVTYSQGADGTPQLLRVLGNQRRRPRGSAGVSGQLSQRHRLCHCRCPASQPPIPDHDARHSAQEQAMPVEQVTEGTLLAPNVVYTTPPTHLFYMEDGGFRLLDRDRSNHTTNLVTTVLTSLAKEQGSRTVGVILSGTGNDGTTGLMEVKKSGGICMAQDKSAAFEGMPTAALESGVVDHVGSPAELAGILQSITRGSKDLPDKSSQSPSNVPLLKLLLNALERATGKSFAQYKEGTVTRRIERRMAATNCSTQEQYLALLEHRSGEEPDLLAQDLLIHVTSFFRDGDLWKELENNVLPLLLQRAAKTSNTLRIWIIGCSTGQEAYSYAMMLDDLKLRFDMPDVQFSIFATDMDGNALRLASRGSYTEAEMASVPDKYQRLYFTKTGNEFHICPEIRKRVIFAVHDILRNPPYFQMALVSCRNVLIYFKPQAQTKVFSVVHYSLISEGFMVLGAAETLCGDANSLFRVTGEHKIYHHRKARNAQPLSNLMDRSTLKALGTGTGPTRKIQQGNTAADISVAVNSFLTEVFAPATVVFDTTMTILYCVGNAGDYLELTRNQGVPTLDILKAARPGLRAALSAASRSCRKGEKEASFTGIELKSGDSVQVVDLTVRALVVSCERLYAATFQPNLHQMALQQARSDDCSSVPSNSEIFAQQVVDLETELMVMRSQLQVTVEELEGANEELQSTIEELLSSNEELQSLNEELQSVNEELFSVNNEFGDKINELAQTNLDLANLLRSTNIGCVFLDEDLYIRKFTDAACNFFPLCERDLERPFSDLAAPGAFSTVVPDSIVALTEGHTVESEVQLGEQFYLVQCIPYINEDQTTSGVVVVVMDVTSLGRLLQRAEAEKETAEERGRTNSEFLECISHETRSPVHAISGFAELLLQSQDLSVDNRRCVSYIYRSATVLAALLDDVLDISAMQGGIEFRQVSVKFDLYQVMKNMVELLSLSASEKSLELFVDYDTKLPLVCLQDEARVRQALLNLVANAIKFTDAGHIHVRAQLISSDSQAGTFVAKLSVTDTGPGIPSDMLGTIFDRFQQGPHAQHVSRPGGVGLGLSIARKFVSCVGGELSVESVMGVGSTFHFQLECSLPANEPAQYLYHYAAPSRTGPPVLEDINEGISLLLPRGAATVALKLMLIGLGIHARTDNSVCELLAHCDAFPSTSRRTKGCVVVCASLLQQRDEQAADHPELANLLRHFSQVIVVVGMLELVTGKQAWPTTRPGVQTTEHPIAMDWLLSTWAKVTTVRRSSLVSVPYISVAPKLRQGQEHGGEECRENENDLQVKALLIDDSKLNQMIGARLLDRLSVSTDVAEGGQEALIMASAEVYDIIFLDLSMPIMSGYDVIPLLRAQPGCSDVPVVALTASVSADAQQRCEAAGFSSFVTKPAGLARMREVLAELVPRFKG